MKSKQKYRIFWTGAAALAVLAMSYLIIPPLIPLSSLRADLESALSTAAGRPVKIDGDIRLSLLGYPMLAADKVRVEGANIASVRFRVSWPGIFDLKNADIVSGVKVQGLEMDVKTLAIPRFGRKIMISDSVLRYGGREYEVVDGAITDEKISARVRTESHKYDLIVAAGAFVITNLNEALRVEGNLASDDLGNLEARGTLSIESRDINKWFEFPNPKISGKTKASMDFYWNEKGEFDFSNIKGTNGKASFAGRVKLWFKDGVRVHKSVRMKIDNADLDLSFLKDNGEFLYRSDFNVSINGDIKTPSRRMDGVKKLSLEMVSGESDMDILGFAASNEKMSVSAAGKIADESARDLDVAISMDGRSLRCVLSGDDKNFGCGRWSFADEKMSATGTLAVFGNEFQMVFKSKNAAADIAGLVEKYIGKKNGSVEFEIGDKAGVMAIGGGRVVTEYVEKNATLENFPKKLPIPKDMRSVSGNIAAKIDGGKISLVFQSAEWTLSIDDENRFMLSHKDAGKLLASLTGKPVLPFVKPRVPVRIVGKFSEGMITEMNAEIADMRLGGTVIGDSITLAAADLDLDKILDEKWFAEFRDNQYLSGDPILAPFGFGAKLALKAGAVVLNGARYRGVTYYLDEGGQYLSIADADAGKMLIGVSKEKSKYKFLVKLDKFFIPRMFGETAPVNIEGATVTAEAELESRGLTARDIRKNMTGVIDLSADGGFLIGLGVDAFYDNAARYDKRDVEGAVVKMLSDGRTAIKELSVSGEYNGGDFRTTKPFLLIARHADITGNVSIQNNKAAARANIMLRGTNALPKPIALNISNGRRDWAISEILSDIDLYYLREFASTRGKF